MSKPSNRASASTRRRAPSATAIGFVAAFALSVATIIYTGLKVGAPRRGARSEPQITIEVEPSTATATSAPLADDPNASTSVDPERESDSDSLRRPQ